MDKLLIIDDSAVQIEFLRSILKEDYEITACQTAEDGLRAAKEGNFSLILLDVVMPGTDGFTVLRELKETELTRHVPVIMLTSLADVQYEERGLVLGAVDYVAKPFSPVIIKARVHAHVQLYRYQMEFKKQATIDELTGVANRRHYEQMSAARWGEAIRFNLPLSICMFDIDKFKVYNDTYGHPAGDHVISSVAKTVSAHFQRATDLFARYGGEEFVAVFIGNDAQSAFDHMKAVRQAVEDLHIPCTSGISPWVTISAGGVSVLPKSEDRYETFLKISDTMLYDAKRFGRNQVVWSNAGHEQWREK